VLDAQGKVLRRYSSEDKASPTPEQLRTNLIPPMWPQITGPLPATAGMHRWVWDLRATAPTATDYQYPISAVPNRTPSEPEGPLVVPGTYTVKLTVEGHNQSLPLLVKMDPRVHTPAADLEALHAAQTAMAASLDALAKADLAAHSLTEQLSTPENASLSAQLAPFSDALKTLLDGAGAKSAKRQQGIDELTDEAAHLYGELQQADVAPTPALHAAALHLEDEAKEALPRWEEFKEKQLPALNDKLRDAHRPAVVLSRPPQNMPQSGDED
jgi:hypothetical protein